MDEPSKDDGAAATGANGGVGGVGEPILAGHGGSGAAAGAVNGAAPMEVDGVAKAATATAEDEDDFEEGPGEGGAAAALPDVTLEEADAIEAYQEVRQEQIRQIEEAKAKARASEGAPGSGEERTSRKLEYLMAQSEMFAHFLGAQSFQKKDGRRKGSVKMSMEEKDEDVALMKTATANHRVTRLLQQPSSIVNGTMRPYQLEGLNWMIRLHDNGINGILADEMGLGKTLQTISLLAYLRDSRNMHGPHLIIVPKSTVGNWMREIARWCPTLKAVKLLGTKDERLEVVTDYLSTRGTQRPFNVLVTSYEGVLREKGSLQRIQWRYVIIDEAHRIKNEKSALSKMVRMFKSHFRLLITGTPLQNDLHELWALLNYIMPDVFESSDSFDEWFNIRDGDNVVRKLHQVLKPFMLRRVKADVEKDLPPKKETKLYIGMTDMQKEWYRKILRRDGASLNMLGGTDRLRLLNILMQLRKVCNHPYLFEGAEPGPPYEDGPHIWENCGKMVLLNKLLPKLKAKGSRVLIFCQMTRQLDILEDYVRMKGYQYCRIDGSTKGEDRDEAVEVFNMPNSEKFCFLLSTRAGGLGLNLATADTVVLYDSDWNPQVDLQAMDRAHRIGQTKEVRVFRLVTEGTVEEKIIERADRKLYLDAAVIQQGRLAEKHQSVSRDELLHMVRFGADAILTATGDQGITDEDIDLILQKGEAKTAEQDAKYKKDVQHNLAKFTLMGDDERNLFEFEGENWRNKRADGIVIDMGQRERKPIKNYDVDQYYRGALKGGKPTEKRSRKLSLPEHQFFNRARLQELHEKEVELQAKRQAQQTFVRELRQGRKTALAQLNEDDDPVEVAEQIEGEIASGAFDLSRQEQSERDKLREEGFKNWSRRDFRVLINAFERYGRNDKASVYRDVCAETGKSEAELTKYLKVFWDRFEELPSWQSILDRIKRGEQRILRNKEIKEALDSKVARHKNPLASLTINYGPQAKASRAYNDEEDVFLVVLMHKYGYGNWDRIRMEIRRSEKFSFDWFFKSRTASELQKRGDALIKLIEKENADAKAPSSSSSSSGKRKREEGDETQSVASADNDSKAASKKSKVSGSAKKRGK